MPQLATLGTVTDSFLIVIIRGMRRKLSPKLVEHLKTPGPKRMDVWDTVLQCFGVRVSPSGRKSWFVIARFDGRQKRITIGTYPAMSLGEARTEARRLIRDAQLGVLSDSKKAPPLTFGETIPLFVRLYAKPKNRGWKESERLLGKFQALFGKPLTQIVRSDVVRVLDEIVASGTPYRANRVLSALKKLMNWALDRGMIEVNPIAGLKPPHRECSRERVLNDQEVRALLIAMEEEGYPFGDAFKLLLLTGQRRGEIAAMQRSEIDLGNAIWSIPGDRTKNKQRHDVPLAPAALYVFRALPRFINSDYVFTTTGRTPISGLGRAKNRLAFAAGVVEADARLTSDGCLRHGAARHSSARGGEGPES
jgi:integrase